LIAVHAAPYEFELLEAGGAIRMDSNTYETEPETHFNGVADMRFILFTRSNPTVGHQLILNNVASVVASHFNPAHPTRLTVHGWQEGANSSPNPQMRNAYLAIGDFNVITVDWSVGASSTLHSTARNRIPEAGEVTAQFLRFMQNYGLNLNNVYIIGHELGAHVAGFAGKHTNGAINTIFGTDPAGRSFNLENTEDRLAPGDAQYVETIVTSGGNIGLMGHSGHTSFFPNGGTSQPGCGIDFSSSCASERSNLFLAESIIQGMSRFFAMNCQSMQEINNGVCTPSGPGRRMGGEPSLQGSGANGVYRVNTNDASPFGQG
jgi:pancreatic triacylglycerol lipase